MPEQTKAASSTVCWIELSTTDLAAGRRFYEGLFGWKTSDMPGGIPYAIASNAGSDAQVAGMAVLSDDARKMGAPSNWLTYIAVDDAAVSAKAITQAGGKVLLGPLQMGPGNMVVAQDPTGATFGLWQQLQSMGTFQFGETGSLGWNEVLTNNVDRAGKFYATVFGWKLEPGMNPEINYTVFRQGDRMVGGMMGITKDMGDAPPSWWIYFNVDDCDAALALATKLGGKIHRPGTDIPNIGRFGVVEDPQGAMFCVAKFLPPPK
jgi:predicted enzyme related to lactoylglutathione lyase